MSIKTPAPKEKKVERKNSPPLEFDKVPVSAIVDRSDDVIVFVTPEGLITDWNKSAEKLYGYAKAEVIGKPIWQLAPADEQQAVIENIEKARNGATISQHELKRTGKDGKEFHVSLNIAPVRDAGGGLAGLIGIARDITKRKRDEQEQKSYRLFLDNIKDACFEFDLKGKCIFCNEAAHQMLGYSRKEYMSLSHRQRFKTQAMADHVFHIYNNVYTSRVGLTLFEAEMFCKNGSTISIEMSVSPIFDNQGTVTGFRGVGRDITDREKKQTELERYRDFIENVTDSCFESDLNGTLTYANEATAKGTGYTRAEIIGMNHRDYSKPVEAARIYKIYNQIFKTGNPETITDYEVLNKDGQSKFLDISVSLVRDADGRPVGFRGVSRDVTETKKTQEALRQSEARYHNLFEHNNAVMLLIDPDTGQIVDANRAACIYYGYTKEELLSKKITDINTLNPEELREEMNRARLEQRNHFYFQHRLASGVVRPVEIFTGPVEVGGKSLLYSIIHDISERREAEEALRASEEKYRTIIQSMVDAYYESDLNGRFTFANEVTCATLGYPPAELLRLDYKKFTTPETGRKVREVYQQTFKTGIPTTLVDYEIICRDGTVRTHQLNVALMRDASGKPIGFRSVSRDITERKRAEDALRKSEEQYRSLVDNMQDAVFRADLEGTILFTTPSAARILGTPSVEDIIGLNIANDFYYAPEESYKHMEIMGRRGQLSQFEITLKRRDNGKPVMVSANIQFTYDQQGNIVGIEGVYSDITKRKLAEAALKESEQKHKFLTENMNDVVWTMNMDLRTVYVTPSIETVLGFTQEERLRQSVNEQLTPNSLSTVTEIMARELAAEIKGDNNPHRSVTLTLEFYHKNGSTRWLETIVSGIRNDQGVLTGFYGVSRDVTERRQAEEALRTSEEKYRTILENITEGYFESDTQGHFSFVNDAACAMTGYGREQLLKIHYREFTTPETKKRMEVAYRRVFQTGLPINLDDYEIVRQDGSIRTHQLSISLMKDAAGNKTGFRSVARDITEKKKAEEELRRSEQRIRALFENMPVPTLVWKGDQNKLILTEFNEAALQYTNGKIIEKAGKTPEEAFANTQHIAFDMHQCFALRSNIEKSFWFNDGGAHENKYVTIKYAFAPPDNVIMHIIDTTAQKRAEENLKYISVHDALTGLYNRFYSDAEITRISASRLRPVSFIVIDLNDLKMVNDRKGHAAGDLYIKNTAALLKQTFRPEDMIARVGGDEFIVMLPLVDENTCIQALERLKDNLARFNLDADQPISMAIGFATTHTGDNVNAVIAEADSMMYEEKARMKTALKTMAGG